MTNIMPKLNNVENSENYTIEQKILNERLQFAQTMDGSMYLPGLILLKYAVSK